MRHKRTGHRMVLLNRNSAQAEVRVNWGDHGR